MIIFIAFLVLEALGEPEPEPEPKFVELASDARPWYIAGGTYYQNSTSSTLGPSHYVSSTELD